MTISEQIENDYIAAFKNHKQDEVDMLRLLKSSLKNEQIKVGHELSDAEVLAVLSREVKQRQEAITLYTSGNRPELADKEATEIKIIQSYLPEALGNDELAKMVDEALAETGATTKAEMGKVIGLLKSKLSNPTDVSRAAQLISQKLN